MFCNNLSTGSEVNKNLEVKKMYSLKGIWNKRTLAVALVAALVMAAFPVVQPAAASETAQSTGFLANVVNARYLNVRSGPSADYDIVGVLQGGQQVYLVGRNAGGTWVQLQADYGPKWVNARYIGPHYGYNILSLPVTDGSQATPTGTVAYVYYLNVRSGPGVQYPIVTTLAAGTQVQLLARNADASWVQLMSNLGSEANPWWVNARYVSTSYNLWNLPLASQGGPVPSSRVHIVQYGDTLYSIARSAGTNVSTLMALNNLSSPNLIYVGQRIILGGDVGNDPGPDYGVHTVQAGETLYSIARHYNTTVAVLAQINGILNPSLIYVGQRITLPAL
jgi:LysM repeat protein